MSISRDLDSKINLQLDDALKMLNDTQQVGICIMSDLDDQKNKISKSRRKVATINNDLTTSNVVLTRMKKREQYYFIKLL